MRSYRMNNFLHLEKESVHCAGHSSLLLLLFVLLTLVDGLNQSKVKRARFA